MQEVDLNKEEDLAGQVEDLNKEEVSEEDKRLSSNHLAPLKESSSCKTRTTPS